LRSRAIVIVIALSAAFALLAATPSKKPKPTGAKTIARKATAPNTSKAKGTTASKKKAGKKASGKPASKQTATRYRRSTQREPSPERYQEIQKSLADKGYYSGPVNGAWGQDSVQELKRFQRDQNIVDDGKLGSLSLMALGLGPKRGTSGAEPP